MNCVKEVKLQSKERVVVAYKGIGGAELENAVHDMMLFSGYRDEKGGIYVKGNRTMRILFGAFCKYFKFKIAVDATNPEELLVGIHSMSSGMSGGVIGMNQIKKELQLLGEKLQQL